MKQAVLDLINSKVDAFKADLIAAIMALSEDSSAEVAALQQQLADKQAVLDQVQAHVVDVEGQLASDEAKIAAIKVALGV